MELKLTKQKKEMRFFSDELKRYFSIVLMALLLSFTQNVNAQAPDWEWAKGIGGTENEYAGSIAVDGFGNVYSTGEFHGSVDFDPGVGVFNLNSAGLNDIFISKLDNKGNFVWAKRIGGPGEDGVGLLSGRCIVLDESGNIYCTAKFGGVYVAKLDNQGNFIWERKFCDQNSQPTSISLDVNNNVYITGQFRGACDFDPGLGIYTLTYAGGLEDDIFICKLDSAGIFSWAKRIGGSDTEWARNAVSDAFGNIYITGGFKKTVDFDPNSGVFKLKATGIFSVFIVKLDSAGNFGWAISTASIGANSTGIGHGISLDKYGSIYSTGSFRGSLVFDSDTGAFMLTAKGSDDIYILKLDVLGNFVWAKAMGSPLTDEGISISVDVSGDVYTLGIFNGKCDFDPDTGVYNLTAKSGTNIFITKLGDTGNLVWAQSIIHGFGINFILNGKDITVDNKENIYIMGPYNSSSIVFDSTTIYNNGQSDIFIAKIPVNNIADPCINTTCNITPYAYYTNVTSSTCNNGTIKAILKGGYKFYPHLELYDGNNTLVDSISLPKGTKTYTFTGLSAGKYTIKIFDKTCCETSDVKYIKCAPPATGYSTTNITATTATLNWDTASCSVGYRVQYRQPGTTLWTTQKLSSNTGLVDIAGLQPSTTYEWHVSTFCAGTQKFKYLGASPIQTFTTNALRVGEVITQSNATTETFEINLFPNPATYTLAVNFECESETANLKVINMLGEVVMQKQINAVDGIFETQINIANLKSGIYMLKVETENGESRKVFVKE